MGILVRPAAEAELAEVGEITARAYLADGLVRPNDGYVAHLRDAARRAREGTVLVAVETSSAGERVIGTVTFALGGQRLAQFAGEREAEIRMLAVDPPARRAGAGNALVAECLRRAHEAGCHRVVLSTMTRMQQAHRIYARRGFSRATELDWEPEPGITLLCYSADLS